MQNLEKKIRQKLEQSLAPEFMELTNESHQHRGHAGDDGSGESHFSLKICSKKFKNKSRLECHKMINDILKAQFNQGLHALTIKIA